MLRTDFRRARYWRRLREPLDEWWPRGWLLLAALFLLFFVGTFVLAPRIEQQVQNTAARALRDAGFDVLSVTGSGQRLAVKIRGVADPERAQAQVEAATRGVLCATWAGPLVCPTAVRVDLVPLTPAEVTPTPPQQAPRYHDLVLERDGERLQINGEVDSNETKLWLLARARSAFPQAQESLAVTGERASPMFPVALQRGLALLEPLLRGSVRWEQGSLKVQGLVAAEAMAQAEAAYGQIEPALNPAAAAFTAAQSEESCASELTAALRDASIQFATASASIEAASARVLDELAAVAATCPGDLLVEGHTDDRGAAEANERLSQRRAEAVRLALIERGISGGRLQARGFGETSPVAANDTADGRAANRRIVVRLAP